jgi:methylated-DNA-protein-cysteine methyltransferase related protein
MGRAASRRHQGGPGDWQRHDAGRTARPLPGRSGASRPVTPTDSPTLQAIWHVVCTIPRGQVSTYGAVARAAGLPGRARQAGFALRVAPAALNLPWHRVVAAGGRIAFARSSPEYREQARRLRAEGVHVAQGRVERRTLTDLA